MFCNKCTIAIDNRFTPCMGKGTGNKKVMFIGEAPGYYEAKYKIPFIGKAGGLLTYFMTKYNFPRNDCYITNTVKCRPFNNDAPSTKEVINCAPYLAKELITNNPKFIVLLGNTALQLFFGKEATISKYRKKHIVLNNRIFIFMYHPAYILRNPKLVNCYDEDFSYLTNLYRYFDPDHYPNT